MMNWFERLTGFREESPEQVRRNIVIDGDVMTSRVNGRIMTHGTLETPTLGELRNRVRSLPPSSGQLSLREIIADVESLHAAPAHQGALFQVASQFNLLEMISPKVTPEQGISRYESDLTQGPACAVAAGAGTLYRNYFVPLNGTLGQSATHQIDCLQDLGHILGNGNNRLWTMKNGYALATGRGLKDISNRLQSSSSEEQDQFRKALRIGIQWNTEVTVSRTGHTVTQVYGSALPVAYSMISAKHWEAFATLILEASYEATLCAAILNRHQTGNPEVFLTLLGGGAFGNQDDWIAQALLRALKRYQNYDLEVAIVSFRGPQRVVQQVIDRFMS